LGHGAGSGLETIASGYGSLAIGHRVTSSHQFGVAIGYRATTSANNQLVVNVSGTSTPSLRMGFSVGTGAFGGGGSIALANAYGYLTVLISNVSYKIPLLK